MLQCHKCKKEGNHHTALRSPNKVNNNQPEEEITCLVKSDTNILLQTTNTLVADKNKTQVRATKLLLDAESQQTFLIHSLVDELNLKPVREINMEVSSFLSKKQRLMKLKEYESNIKNISSSGSKLIKCLCVPKICQISRAKE